MARQEDDVTMDVLRRTLQGMPQEPVARAMGGYGGLDGGGLASAYRNNNSGNNNNSNNSSSNNNNSSNINSNSINNMNMSVNSMGMNMGNVNNMGSMGSMGNHNNNSNSHLNINNNNSSSNNSNNNGVPQALAPGGRKTGQSGPQSRKRRRATPPATHAGAASAVVLNDLQNDLHQQQRRQQSQNLGSHQQHQSQLHQSQLHQNQHHQSQLRQPQNQNQNQSQGQGSNQHTQQQHQSSSLLLGQLAGNEEVTPDMIAKVLMQIPEATERERQRRASQREETRNVTPSLTAPSRMDSASSGASRMANTGPQNRDLHQQLGQGSIQQHYSQPQSHHHAQHTQLQHNQHQLTSPHTHQQDQQQEMQQQRRRPSQASMPSVSSSLPMLFNNDQTNSTAHLQSNLQFPGQSHFNLQQGLSMNHQLMANVNAAAVAAAAAKQQHPGRHPESFHMMPPSTSMSEPSFSGPGPVTGTGATAAAAGSVRVNGSEEYEKINQRRKQLLSEAEFMKLIPEELEANTMKPRTRKRYSEFDPHATRAVKLPGEQPFSKTLETDLVDCLQPGGSDLDRLKTQKLIDATGLLQEARQHALEPLTLYTRSELFELFASIAEVWKNSGKSAWKKRINKVKENARYRKAPRNGPTDKESNEIAELTARIKEREVWENNIKSKSSGKTSSVPKRSPVFQDVNSTPESPAPKQANPRKARRK